MPGGKERGENKIGVRSVSTLATHVLV